MKPPNDPEFRESAPPPPPKKGSPLPLILGALALLLLVGGCAVGILAILMLPAVQKAKEKAHRVKCANNLRMLGMASVMYADDKRSFPHVRGLGELDGDYTTSDGSKTFRTLVWYGYLDNPVTFICPQSQDAPAQSYARPAQRAWFWDVPGQTGDSELSPLVDGLPDPPLRHNRELSYGYTRRPLGFNASSRSLVAADRAARPWRQDPGALPGDLGNHQDGWNLLHADASVEFRSAHQGRFPGPLLVGTQDPQEDGFLGISPQLEASPFR